MSTMRGDFFARNVSAIGKSQTNPAKRRSHGECTSMRAKGGREEVSACPPPLPTPPPPAADGEGPRRTRLTYRQYFTFEHLHIELGNTYMSLQVYFYFTGDPIRKYENILQNGNFFSILQCRWIQVSRLVSTTRREHPPLLLLAVDAVPLLDDTLGFVERYGGRTVLMVVSSLTYFPTRVH
ncbi:hypothetical protein CBL_09660 [Carabus blaptoides fortunei]